MQIVCDVDGVLADLHTEWLARYNARYDDRLTVDQVTSWSWHEHVSPKCGSAIYEILLDEDLYDPILPVAGAIAGIARLRALGHTIVFATTCSFGMADQKARWLQRFHFCEVQAHGSLPPDFVVTAQKHLLAGDLLIDDGPHNVRQWIMATQRRAIMLRMPYNEGLAMPSMFWPWCERPADWEEIVARVEALS